MRKNILFTATMVFCLGGLSYAQGPKKGGAQKTEVKFLEDISVTAAPTQAVANDPKAVFSEPVFTQAKAAAAVPVSDLSIEKAGELQFKYALLLDTEVESVQNLELFRTIDEWFGTRYRLGGNSKDGIDCSALMQTFSNTVFGVSLPRTAREQFSATARISRTELREGDLVFFNTIGGVSHVGMYLQNNKFVHASSGGGVTVSDLFDEYWMRKFIGAGRMGQSIALSSSRP